MTKLYLAIPCYNEEEVLWDTAEKLLNKYYDMMSERKITQTSSLQPEIIITIGYSLESDVIFHRVSSSFFTRQSRGISRNSVTLSGSIAVRFHQRYTGK